MSVDLYLALAAEEPTVVKLGGGLITMTQTHEGREEAYNRWYEDDHYVSGAMAGPWLFSGRRFVRCKLRRFAAAGLKPTDAGSFITLYWAIEGHVDDAFRWTHAVLKRLIASGRGPRDRTHVYSAMHELAFAHIFDPPPMAAIHALDYPYRGLAVELVDAPNTGAREQLVQWLRDEYVPSQDGPIGQCLAFGPHVSSEDGREVKGSQGQSPVTVPQVIGPDTERRVCLLWFLRADPQEFWPGLFAKHAEEIDAGGLGRLVLLAPFVPTLPGTVTPLADAKGTR